MRYLFSLILASVLSVTGNARSVADIEIPERTSMPGYEGELVLNGAGVRTKMFFKIYVAALYLPSPVKNAEKIVSSEVPKRVSMSFLYSEVSKKKMDDAWQDGFSGNVPPEQMNALTQRLNRFKDMFGTMKEGDVVWLDYLPETGTRVTINGVDKGVIDGQDFSAALLNVWLGQKPVTDSLKGDLLGK